MKKALEIYREGDHSWMAVTRDPAKQSHLIDTNEYVITSGSASLLTDPGGMEIFPAVFSALCDVMDPRNLVGLFASHQDPDIISSLSLWLELKKDLKCYTSWLWTSFIPHFGGEAETFVAIPDEGMPIPVGNLELQAVPAHFLHSSGNFHLYDPKAKLLFSGDIGAAMLPGDASLFVEDFDEHIKKAEGFHRRWMGSTEAKRSWCERAAKLDIDMMCPQHGAIYKGADVMRFINWFDELKIGLSTIGREKEKKAA